MRNLMDQFLGKPKATIGSLEPTADFDYAMLSPDELIQMGYLPRLVVVDEIKGKYGYGKGTVERFLCKKLPPTYKVILDVKFGSSVFISAEGRQVALDHFDKAQSNYKLRPRPQNAKAPAGAADILGIRVKEKETEIPKAEKPKTEERLQSIEDVISNLPILLGMPQAETIKIVMSAGVEKTSIIRVLKKEEDK
jgi:hypothetical protein